MIPARILPHLCEAETQLSLSDASSVTLWSGGPRPAFRYPFQFIQVPMKPFKWLARSAGNKPLRARKAAQPPNPQKDRAAIRKSLSPKLSKHLLKDVGGHDE